MSKLMYTIGLERRPCIVIMYGEEVRAMFHTWFNGQAVIELENGAVHLYSIEQGSLVFLDHSEFEGYDWSNDTRK